jgi:REP element-mobilizing transposase RayT
MHDINTADCGRIISAPTIPKIIGSFKRYVSKNTGIKLWQKSYYDHIIRNEKEFLEICDYIDNNPLNWINNKFNLNKWR